MKVKIVILGKSKNEGKLEMRKGKGVFLRGGMYL